jgi:phosphatidate cytidylyltransferase
MLRNRLMTALLLGIVFVTALYALTDLLWALFLLLFIVTGAWEWGGLNGYARPGRVLFCGVVLLAGLLLLPGVVATEWVRLWGGMLLVMGSTLFWLLVVPLWLARGWRLHSRVLSALTGALLLLAPWIALVDLRHIAPEAVLAVVLTVVLADSAAYFSGRRFGRRKLAPHISPGKTWEGLLGALLAVALFASALCIWLRWSPWFVIASLAIVILSVMGDLFESMIKRQAGRKDSGTLLPGHGGVLDRIDGLTSTLPLVTCYAFLPFYLGLLTTP